MVTAPIQISNLLQALVNDVKEQLDEIRQAQTSISDEIEQSHALLRQEINDIKATQQRFQGSVDALQPWRDSVNDKVRTTENKADAAFTASTNATATLTQLDARVQQAESSATDAVASSNNATTTVAQVAHQHHQLNGKVDDLLTHHE